MAFFPRNYSKTHQLYHIIHFHISIEMHMLLVIVNLFFVNLANWQFPGIWSNIILDVSTMVLLGNINI